MIDQALKKYDGHNMYSHLNSFYKQLLDGVILGETANTGNLSAKTISNIILAGMGGSAIGGEIIRSLVKREFKIFFEIHRNYGLPAFADDSSLVICSSYSGNTEETLSAFAAAIDRKCRILCITTGGELLERARQHGLPAIVIPSGLMPREALGYSVAPLLVVFGKIGLCRDYKTDLKDCAGFLQDRIDKYAFKARENKAYDLADKLKSRIAVIYSGPDYLDAVALRIKGQISENGKQLAFCNIFPEFNHNELVGWELAPRISDKFVVMILRDSGDHDRIARRMDIVEEILKQKNVEVVELWAEGDSMLTRMFSLIQLGDYMSYYLALVNELDPTPIALIDDMKNKLVDK
jgi:glucose/mannose-6-phosphate isomerase